MERLAVVLDNMVMDKTSLNDTRSTSYAFSIRTLKYFMGMSFYTHDNDDAQGASRHKK